MTPTRAMSLHELLAGQADPGFAGDIVVRGLALDSREGREGDVFVALEGSRHHGITFAPTALARGAQAILAERPEAAGASAPALLNSLAEGRSDLSSPAKWEKMPEGQMRERLNIPII